MAPSKSDTGSLTDIVEILQDDGTGENPLGEQAENWVVKQWRWAEISGLRGTEQWVARQTMAEQVFKVRFHYVEGLNPLHRLRERYGGRRTFGIVSVDNPDRLKLWHVCECVHLVNVQTVVDRLS